MELGNIRVYQKLNGSNSKHSPKVVTVIILAKKKSNIRRQNLPKTKNQKAALTNSVNKDFHPPNKKIND